jgi:hypothetical protein
VGSSPTPRALGSRFPWVVRGYPHTVTEPAGRPGISLLDLERWEDNGATWRAVEISDEVAVIELCTCYGEPVDMVRSSEPELIEYVRSHPQD